MRLRLALSAAALLLLAGCGTDTSGTPTTAAVPLWDPCTEVSDHTLQSAGLDPSTRNTTISGVERVDDWKLCSWKNQGAAWDYSVGVWATSHTLEEIKANPVNADDFQDVTIAGRTAVQHGVKGASAERVCYLEFPAGAQVLSVSASKTVSGENPQDPCALATAAAEIIAPEFPA